MIIEELTRSDCLTRLARARLGRLACARENQPYVLPFYFAYREPYLYGFTTFGQKVEWMRANPLVCVELDEVDDYEQWTTIVLFGRYEELPDTDEWREERLRAWGLLKEHACWWEPGSASRSQVGPKQVWAPIYFRIHISEVTGRRARPDTIGLLERTQSAAFPAASQGWFRKLTDALSALFARERKGQKQA